MHATNKGKSKVLTKRQSDDRGKGRTAGDKMAGPSQACLTQTAALQAEPPLKDFVEHPSRLASFTMFLVASVYGTGSDKQVSANRAFFVVAFFLFPKVPPLKPRAGFLASFPRSSPPSRSPSGRIARAA